jgi:hypothetical protein
MTLPLLAIATDYDGTLATNGHADETALAALLRARAAGRKLIMITGREQDSLRHVFPAFTMFQVVVLENGALLYFPATAEERLLCEPAPQALATRLRQAGVEPLSVGRCIIATVIQHEQKLREAISELRLDLQVIRNRDSLMALPRGVDKGSGLAAAVRELGLELENVMGVGDAENDHAFLDLCGCAVAVGNALPALKADADLVTRGNEGAGVVEAVHRLLSGSG